MTGYCNLHDDTEEKIVCGIAGYLLLKEGYTPNSIARALSVQKKFVQEMSLDGIRFGIFPEPDKKITGMFMKPVKVDKVDFFAAFRRVMSPETPANIFCQIWGMSLKELKLAEDLLKLYEKMKLTGTSFLNYKRPAKNAVKSFVEKRCEVNATSEVDSKKLFSLFQSFAKSSNGKEISSIQSFSKMLRQYVPSIQTVRYRAEEGLSRKYIGIGLKS